MSYQMGLLLTTLLFWEFETYSWSASTSCSAATHINKVMDEGAARIETVKISAHFLKCHVQ